MSSEPVIFVIGLPGSGKSTLSHHLAELLSTSSINAGDALRSHLALRNIPLVSPLDSGSVFVERCGLSAVGPTILAAVNEHGSRIVDGPRLFATLTHFRDVGRSVDVAYVYADEGTRRSRFRQRSVEEEEANPSTIDDVLRLKDNWSSEVSRFVEVSRWAFDNSGPIGDLHEFARRIALDCNSTKS